MVFGMMHDPPLIIDESPLLPSSMAQWSSEGQVIAAVIPKAPDMVGARLARVDQGRGRQTCRSQMMAQT
jgi:hypothetical protein